MVRRYRTLQELNYSNDFSMCAACAMYLPYLPFARA